MRRGWRATTFHEAVTAPRWTKTMAVTFDDGYRSVRERAWPVLQRLGIPATVFVPTALVGWPGPLHWEGIEEGLGPPREGEVWPMGWGEARRVGRGGGGEAAAPTV